MIRIKKFNEKEKTLLNSNFWDWFENSKVVDKSGNPLVLYHGSDSDMGVIDVGRNEPGAWFTTNYKNAANYSSGLSSGGVYSVYLKIEKPLVAYFPLDAKEFYPIIKGLTDDPNLSEEELEDIISENNLDSNLGIVQYVKRRGFHDGVHFPTGNYTESDETWVILDQPTQAKSIYNDGSFDDDDPNIYR